MTEEILTPLLYDAQHSCFGCGQLNEIGLRLTFSTTPTHEVVSHFHVPERFQGPHGFAHGGVIASVLDEVMSKAIHASPHAEGLMAMTRHMETNYLRPVPLSTPVVLRGRQVSVAGRKHFCESTLSDESGTLLATGKALFIAIPRQPEHKH
ncbi:MAG TPA: PaaI family thioesterase [Acidobacteriaceae bacterium]